MKKTPDGKDGSTKPVARCRANARERASDVPAFADKS
jgi:hypothetical protein